MTIEKEGSKWQFSRIKTASSAKMLKKHLKRKHSFNSVAEVRTLFH